MTSWPSRIENLPTVLGSIFKQTLQPNHIVINLSEDEFPKRHLSARIETFLTENQKVEINWVQGNTKVWKKFLPTFHRYPTAAVIAIDDDLIYPPTMIADLVETHRQHPDSPVSGNHVTWYGLNCHCGGCSLVKYKHFIGIESLIDEDMMKHCYSSDFAYTYLMHMQGIYYVNSKDEYTPRTLTTFNETDPYSHGMKSRVPNTFQYLQSRFNAIERPKVFYNVPWSSSKNIGEAYNQFAQLVPNDAYIAFIDADTIFTTSDYGTIIEECIMNYPGVEAFTAKTNRVGCSWQIAKESVWSCDDMREHRRIGELYRDINGLKCKDRTDDKLFSGFFLVIKKSAWDAIGGAPDGMLGVDNAIHKRLREHGMRLYQMMGLYLYHWYRGGNKGDKAHLK